MARIAVDAVMAVADFETKDVNFELIKVRLYDLRNSFCCFKLGILKSVVFNGLG